jgi:hypothetical protein
MNQTVARVMSAVCEHFQLDLSRYNVTSGGMDLDDYTGDLRTMNIPTGEVLLVDMRPRCIDNCF